MNRRSFLVAAALTSFATLGYSPSASAEPATKKILFFSKSSGYEHSVISYKNGMPSHAEKVLIELGAKHGWEFTCTKDGRIFTPEGLKEFDAVFFYTTGDLTVPGTDKQPPMPANGRQVLLDYINSGKGFIGTHSASDTFHTANEDKKGPDRYVNHGPDADPYVRMLGAEFIIHGKQQTARMRNVDPKFPGFEKIGEGFDLMEEWYSLKDFSNDIHVLLVQESEKMEGAMYQRPSYPATWARMQGKGRVFYTSMGHREDVWTNPTFQDILVGGIRWSLGEVEADVRPNLKNTTPEATTNPKYMAPKPAPTPNTPPNPPATPKP